jgi:predicted nucleic acid-binding protein
MIVLDTHVLSEPLKQDPDAGVVAWLEELDDEVAICAVTVGELLVGVRRLPEGRRRTALLGGIEQLLEAYARLVLPYAESAARRYAELQEVRRLAGRPLSVEDGIIAAVCAVRRASLATRNVSDFSDLGVALIDPWSLA